MSGTTLSNNNISSITLTGYWTLPTVGSPGTIRKVTGHGEFILKQGKTTILFKFYYSGQWKLVGTTLSNQAGITLTGTWVIPTNVSTPGTIKHTTTGSGYLSVNAKIDAGSEVDEEALDDDDVGQLWERSADDDSGFFNLKNLNSGFFLTMQTANTLTIGKN